MYFESQHSLDNKEFTLRLAHHLVFPPHLHQSFEFFAVRKGTAKMVIDRKEYFLSEGQAVLCFPYQIHSYDVTDSAEFYLSIFSPWLVPQFYELTRSKAPCSNLFLYKKELVYPENIFQKKALAYDICGQFHQTAQYHHQENKKSDLLTRLLLYIAEHYKSDCHLKEIAEEFRYDYVYLSKFFKRATGISFHTYLTNLRIHEGCRLLTSTDLSVNQIAEKCGFSSVRTFHRDFKQLIGANPTVYRTQHSD